MNDYEGMHQEDDHIVRDYEGKAKVEELNTKDPTLSRFVQLGKWCFDALKKLGHIKG